MIRAQTAEPPAIGSETRRGRRPLWGKVWRFRALYLMLLPGFVYYAVYQYGPMYGVVIAFKDYNVLEGIMASPWADPWYKHWKAFYDSPYFGQILANTFLISVYKLVWGMPPGIVLALMLNEVRHRLFKRFVQTVSYLPHFLSMVIIYGLMIALLSQTDGLVNQWLEERTGRTIPFLTSTDWFRTLLVASGIWQHVGWSAIIYLAAIAGIDPTLYEAARCDGAGRLRMMWHITLPGIRNVILLLLVLRLGHILDAGFEQIYIMYNVHVYPVADIIDTWVFRTGLEQMDFSMATAVGLFKSLIGLVLIVASNRLAKRWGGAIW
ncbi:ABC transporter permease [Paenibacillus flagellatus]|uniref:Polysaccharide ABC transporter ATP-binding protein n=1 Tax=Paenibacillus flagellatus TaxID=2211139 RepID=A0A2V5KAF8_9BACL|nr:ABC transporter permease subunit [Paenibacillus flagellatus]PYI56585.1 polysaccharide ABC transporter ATP-binding protein [Paenibacillus flagellatus]